MDFSAESDSDILWSNHIKTPSIMKKLERVEAGGVGFVSSFSSYWGKSTKYFVFIGSLLIVTLPVKSDHIQILKMRKSKCQKCSMSPQVELGFKPRAPKSPLCSLTQPSGNMSWLTGGPSCSPPGSVAPNPSSKQTGWLSQEMSCSSVSFRAEEEMQSCKHEGLSSTTKTHIWKNWWDWRNSSMGNAFATKPDHLSLIPGTRMTEGENHLLQVVV